MECKVEVWKIMKWRKKFTIKHDRFVSLAAIGTILLFLFFDIELTEHDVFAR